MAYITLKNLPFMAPTLFDNTEIYFIYYLSNSLNLNTFANICTVYVNNLWF